VCLCRNKCINLHKKSPPSRLVLLVCLSCMPVTFRCLWSLSCVKRSNTVLVLDNSMLWISSLVHCIRSSVLLLIIVVKVVKVSLTLYMTYYIGASPACSQVVLSLTVMCLSRFVSYCFCSQAPRIPSSMTLCALFVCFCILRLPLCFFLFSISFSLLPLSWWG